MSLILKWIYRYLRDGWGILELRQLEHFMALCEEMHFTKAAEKLRIGQPTLISNENTRRRTWCSFI